MLSFIFPLFFYLNLSFVQATENEMEPSSAISKEGEEEVPDESTTSEDDSTSGEQSNEVHNEEELDDATEQSTEETAVEEEVEDEVTNEDTLNSSEETSTETNDVEEQVDSPQPEQQTIEEDNNESVQTEERVTTKSTTVKEVTGPPYEYGDRAPQISTFKEKLNAIGFGNITVTDYFGSYTKTKVKGFQNYYGLPVTGIVDQVTLDKIDEVYVSPLQYGKRHDDTILLKEMMNSIGYGNITVTTYFGSYTEKRLKKFQSDYGLVVNGIADSVTWNTLTSVYEAGYQQGDRADGIVEMKEKMHRLGFGGMSITSYFGSYTKQRVKDFQGYYGLEVTGIADRKTLDKMDDVLASPLQEGKRHEDTVQLKENLNRLGFGSIKVTNFFGSYTDKKLRHFQDYYGLVANGIGDEPTLAKLAEIVNTPFQNGQRHEDIVTMKKQLNRLGFGTIKVSSYYGNYTERVVRKFQEYYGLVANGIADPVTLERLNKEFDKGFQYGARHEGISELKVKLNSLGFGHIQVTDYYGSYTEKKVKDFQQYYGLNVTGKADMQTQDKIDTVLVSDYQEGKRHDGIIPMKKQLNWLGYGYISETNYFGSYTEKKVRHFQADHNLPVSGIAEENTRKKIADQFNAMLQVGSRHDSVIKLKQDLIKVGFGGMKVTNYYGNYTKQRVEDFQQYYGLKVTGQGDYETVKMLDDILASPFQYGKNSSDTIGLKKKLNQIGFGQIQVTDYYGAYTKKKVKGLQSYYGLQVNGIVDPPTMSKIDKVYNSPFQEGKRHEDTIQLKENLNRLGFGAIQVTTYFGSYTDKKLREFQSYYGLRVNGIADERTWAKMDEILASPFQYGKSHPDTKQLKRYLNRLGYDGIQVTTFFGSFTEKRLKEFQRDYDLPVSGIADEKTWAALEEAAESKETITYTYYDQTLDQAINAQMSRSPQTDKYRNEPGYVSADYVSITETGVITENGVRLRTKPNFDGDIAATVYSGTRVTILNTVTGAEYNGSTKWYEITYNGDTLYVHSSLADPNGMVATTTASINVRADASTSSHIYGTLPKGYQVTIIDKGANWHQISYTTWRNATSSDVKYYMDPANNDQFQHLLLTESVGVSADELNNVLESKGVLDGMGQAFIDGGKKYSVNEAYLISHALLETGHGTSSLANGSIEVGLNQNGQAVIVNSSNRDNLTNIKKTYNMFGIKAYDSCPLTCGATHAYEQGWTTPYKAIVGGAEFIGRDYIHNEYEQNTLYKMRWNINSPWKQYATDIGWAAKQVYGIKNIYSQLNNPTLHFDIPKFK